MVPNKWITRIYETYLEYNNTSYMFGDPNQCSPVEGGSEINYDYLQSMTIKEMCPGIKTLEYIEDSCRYDIKTHQILQTFLKHGKVSAHFQSINNKLLKNICYLNSTRIEVNTICCDIFTKDEEHVTVNFKYDGRRESYKVCQKMPILATTNIKERRVFNTMEFEIEEISGEQFKIHGDWYDLNEFSECFIPSFCHSLQISRRGHRRALYYPRCQKNVQEAIIYCIIPNYKTRIYSFEQQGIKRKISQ